MGCANHVDDPSGFSRSRRITLSERWAAPSGGGSEMAKGRGASTKRRLAHWILAVLALPSFAWGAFVLGATPANAAALTNLSWTVSNNQVSATGVTYSYSFK